VVLKSVNEIQDGGSAILKIQVNDHNSVAIAYIYNKIGSGRKTDVLETEVPSNFTYLAARNHRSGRAYVLPQMFSFFYFFATLSPRSLYRSP